MAPRASLEFLSRDPVDSVVLHAHGLAVRVPSPERYAVHKVLMAGHSAQKGVVAAGVSCCIEQGRADGVASIHVRRSLC
ncbi:GSU2403 family nucleotidyltransferase fold protein, partial [Stenotrophomonas maltophilia]|uniref:GSU2403 family nucleotidyltransferase fold protein n=1 Tax=Stenotrophomonas maltophilia TaxID=40324 RepID=UPI0034E07415